MNTFRVHYLYLAPGIVKRNNLSMIAGSEAEAREAFEALSPSDDTKGRFYVIEYVEAIALSELF